MTIPFYVKTENSLLESMITINKLIDFAKEFKLDTLAICDNTMYGVMEFYYACLKNNIKPIIGLEVKQEETFLLFAKSYEGYQELTKIATILSTNEKDTFKYSKELICIIPNMNINLYEKLKNIYPNIYLGYTNKEKLLTSSEKKSLYLPCIKALTLEQLTYLPYLKAIKEGKTVDNLKIETSEAYTSFLEKTDSLTKQLTEEIINQINLEIKYQPDLLPVYDCKELTADEYLKKLCIEGLKARFGEKTYQVYIDRLKYELSVITKMGFSNYFLVVWDYVSYARSQEIFCLARGSAAGSLVSYLLNITDVDPIKYNLLFERFLNPARVTMPDIDMDIENSRRKEVIDYCINKYGKKRVSGIITYVTLKPKLVIRDVAKVLEINPKKVDFIVSLITDHDEAHKNISLKDNINRNEKLKEIINKDMEVKKLFKIASKLENLKKNISSHAAGIIISSKDLDNYIPLVDTKNIYLSAYSMEYLEGLGILKMDFLGLKNLTIISNIIKDLNKHGIKIDFKDIPLNDSETLKVFEKANTIGIFQFEKEGMRNFLRKLKPNCFEDIIAALSLYRPGPMGEIDTYIRRKQNKEIVDYIDPSLENILKPTYGIIIYQEQIMQIVHVMADYTLSEADTLRKAISKKNDILMNEQLANFDTRAKVKGYKDETILKVKNLLKKFASYGYNRSHAVVYATIAYKLAYLKAHYNAYFMRCLMNSAIGRSISTKDYIYECKCNNLTILKPDINKSTNNYEVEDNKLRYPLNNIKNVGESVSNYILEERKKGAFKDIYDFIRRTYSQTVNKKVLTSLIDASCFDDMGFNHQTLQENLDELINYGELLKDIDEEFALKPEIIYYEEYDNQKLIEREANVFGFYFSGHPVTKYRAIYKNALELKNIKAYFNKNIETIIVIKNQKVVQTKNNENMCFITGEDEMDIMDFIVFPKIFKENFDLKIGDIIKVTGKVEKRFDKYQIIVNNIKKLNN